jgi:hypothetical protein
MVIAKNTMIINKKDIILAIRREKYKEWKMIC